MSKQTPPTAPAVMKKPDEEKAITEFTPYGSDAAIKLNIAMVKALVAVPTKTKKYPSDNDCIKFIALCKARRLNPFEGDAYLIGYDSNDGPKFNLITAHQAFLKRAELNKEYDGMESGVIVLRDDKLVDVQGDFHLDTDKVQGGWATVFFKNRSKPMHKRIRLSRFNKGYGVWKDDAAGMICKCAEADALRSSFPTMLGGLYLKEEMREDAGKAQLTRPVFNATVDVPTDVNPELEPSTPTAPAEVPLADRVRKMCEVDGIKESDLMEFLESIAMADEADDIDSLPEDTLTTVVNQWPDFSSKIKEVCQ